MISHSVAFRNNKLSDHGGAWFFVYLNIFFEFHESSPPLLESRERKSRRTEKTTMMMIRSRSRRSRNRSRRRRRRLCRVYMGVSHSQHCADTECSNSIQAINQSTYLIPRLRPSWGWRCREGSYVCWSRGPSGPSRALPAILPTPCSPCSAPLLVACSPRPTD